MIRSGMLVVALAAVVSPLLAQCPDLGQPLIVDESIYHVTGSDLLTVITPPFPNNGLVGAWLRVVPDEEESAEFYRIVSNVHFAQNNTSVFTVAENLETVGGSFWWQYSGQDEFSIFANLACPPGQAPRPGLAALDFNNSSNATGAGVGSGAAGPYSKQSVAGGILPMTIFGEAATTPPVVLLAGPLSVGSFVFAQGQLDLAPAQTVVLGDGSLTDPFNSQFVLPPSGVLNMVFSIPSVLSGFSIAFQSVNYVSGPGVVALSNAVEVTFL